MTAAELTRALAPLAPRVAGGRLLLAGPPPPALEPVLPVLQTGVRAVLTGRRWYAIGADGLGVGRGVDGSLNPEEPIPWLARKVCVAGDAGWDGLPQAWRLLLPHLFGPPPASCPKAHADAYRHPDLPFGRTVASQ